MSVTNTNIILDADRRVVFSQQLPSQLKRASGFGTVIAGFVLWIIEWPVGANIQSAAI